MQSSFFLDDSSVVQLDKIKTIEKVSRQEFPSGYGEDSGGGNTVKLLESTVARFGPIASFRGTYRSNRWTLPITQRNHSYLPGNYVFGSTSAVSRAYAVCVQIHACACVSVCVCEYIYMQAILCTFDAKEIVHIYLQKHNICIFYMILFLMCVHCSLWVSLPSC